MYNFDIVTGGKFSKFRQKKEKNNVYYLLKEYFIDHYYVRPFVIPDD